MMTSSSPSYPTSYQRIDHRTVFKSLQLESNCGNSSKDTLIADIFSPITNFPPAELKHNKGNNNNNTSTSAHSSSPGVTASNTTYIVAQRPCGSPHSGKSKIPYPLTTIWTNNKLFYLKRSVGGGGGNTVVAGGSLRLRGSKSNLPLIMEPLATETATKVECTQSNTHDNTTVVAGGRFYTTRRKLALISQKPSADPLLKRSLSLRKNFKYSTKTDCPVEQQHQVSSCAAAATAAAATINVKSSSVHDVAQATTTHNAACKDQGDGPRAAVANKMEQQLAPDMMANDKITRECRKLSLNHNGLHSSSATTPTLQTTTTTTQQQQHHQQQHQHHYSTQHSRPLTLATPASTPTTTATSGGGILKTPRSPRLTTSIPIPENNTQHQTSQQHQRQHHHQLQQQQQQHHHQNHQLQQTKTSPDSKPVPKTPPVTPDSPTTYLDDDLDSLYSYTTTSGRSTMSCEHPYVARNGTTFSGRKMKYVVHCSNYAGQVGADYLTPTQRAQRQIRRLKELLCVARQDLEQKDSEILRLTREVVELRLFKASLSSPDERSASSDAVTVREAELKTSQDVSPIVDMVDDGPQKPTSNGSPRHHHHHHHHGHHAASASPTAMMHHQQHLSQNSHHHQHHHHGMHDMQSSFADSGHFEDMTSSSVHSKDSSSYAPSAHAHHDQACGGVVVVGGGSVGHLDEEPSSSTLEQYELQRQELIRMYEQRIEDLVRSQDVVTTDMKRSNNDRIEALLQKLAECNTRYADIVPDYEHAKERIRELEKQLEDLQRKLAEHEEKQKQMYLHMYQKGQEAERIARADQALELAHRAPQNKVSINELLHQLQSTQDELENIRAAECRKECGSNHALLTAKEAISLWVLGARKTIYRRLMEAQKNRTHVDPEVTLQFLKSAVYYFLTDKENSQGHLQAIESILEFSEAEKQNINKARNAK